MVVVNTCPGAVRAPAEEDHTSGDFPCPESCNAVVELRTAAAAAGHADADAEAAVVHGARHSSVGSRGVHAPYDEVVVAVAPILALCSEDMEHRDAQVWSACAADGSRASRFCLSAQV